VEDPEQDEGDTRHFQLFQPEVRATLVDDVVVAVGAFDECYFDDVDLIGQPPAFAAACLGTSLSQTDWGEVIIYRVGELIELYERDGSVVQVHLADWTLITD
jgi:hypothetical protein